MQAGARTVVEPNHFVSAVRVRAFVRPPARLSVRPLVRSSVRSFILSLVYGRVQEDEKRTSERLCATEKKEEIQVEVEESVAWRGTR